MDHDPGGKVRLALDEGITGAATFHGPKNEYRVTLERWWGQGHTYVLFIGMNPSTADAEVDDPTVMREVRRAKRMLDRDGKLVHGLIKMNVMDYRATSPKTLVKSGVVPCSEVNLEKMRIAAENAEDIVCAWGSVDMRLRVHADAAEKMLRSLGRQLHCLGKNKDGSPKHPLYIADKAELVPF